METFKEKICVWNSFSNTDKVIYDMISYPVFFLQVNVSDFNDCVRADT